MKKTVKVQTPKVNPELDKLKKTIEDLTAKNESLKLKIKKMKKKIESLTSKSTSFDLTTSSNSIVPSVLPIKPSGAIPPNFGAWR